MFICRKKVLTGARNGMFTLPRYEMLNATGIFREIKRNILRKFTTEEKIRISLFQIGSVFLVNVRTSVILTDSK